jgi:hypothetical protein
VTGFRENVASRKRVLRARMQQAASALCDVVRHAIRNQLVSNHRH